jgi:hypothetical protein
VCGSFWGLKKIQNGGRCHGNQGAIVFKPIPILLAYLVPLEVGVTGSITAKICEIWNQFNIFCTLVTTVAMETKKGGFNFFFILFIKLHETLLEYAL